MHVDGHNKGRIRGSNIRTVAASAILFLAMLGAGVLDQGSIQSDRTRPRTRSDPTRPTTSGPVNQIVGENSPPLALLGVGVFDQGSILGGPTQSRITSDHVDQIVGENWLRPGVPPPHQDAYSTPNVARMSPKELWELVKQADPARRRVLIALKRPKMNRGSFHGTSLIGAKQFKIEQAGILRSVRGLRKLRHSDDRSPIRLANGTWLPVFAARVANKQTLVRLRQSPDVDFVEPLLIPAQLSDVLACGFDEYQPSSDPRAQDIRIPSNDGSELIPYSYAFHHIDEAWRRFRRLGSAPGFEQGIAVLDTGVSSRQQQFFSRYALTSPSRRSHLRLNRSAETIDDTCFHGTKVASIAAAPLDGRSIAGIAWGAPLTTVKVMHSPISICSIYCLERFLTPPYVCSAINDAINPPDGRPPARVVSMAFGLSYYSPSIADCIAAAYRASPSTVFVAAAGSIVSSVIFPANLDDYVLAVSMVEVMPTGFRLLGRPLTVAYGKEVDFVSATTTGGIPAAGEVGDDTVDEIAKFGYSSAATGMYAGIVALASQYAQSRGWTREQLISALQQSASLEGITDFSGEPVESIIGAGIVDAYRATGGARHAAITGPYVARPGDRIVLEGSVDAVVPPGASPPNHFEYRWTVNGSAAGTGSRVELTAPPSGVLDVRLTVIDTVDGDAQRLTTSQRIKITSNVEVAAQVRLFWASYVADWATFLNGGRHDRRVNVGVLMPQGCSVLRVRGNLMIPSAIGGSLIPDGNAETSIDRGNVGFTVSRPDGLPPNSLEALVHQWHDGFSIVRTKVVYDVLQPPGVDCLVEGVLTRTARG
jgi:hypothetical protein